jgi:two-component system nitrogen regulation response regulator GlnG
LPDFPRRSSSARQPIFRPLPAQLLRLSADVERVALRDFSILVIEDEPAVRALVTATLQSGRCANVLTAATIAEARALWKKDPNLFDIVLTDFTLPDGSAPDLVAEFLAARPDLDVVLMTGLPEDSLGLDPAVSRSIRIFPKPFRPGELLAFIKDSGPVQTSA